MCKGNPCYFPCSLCLSYIPCVFPVCPCFPRPHSEVLSGNPETPVISVPQLCAYIFAILFEFSGIFNQLFRLNFLYFHRNTALSIESGRTAFVTSPLWGRLMPAMSSEHVTVGPIENTVSSRHVLLRFHLNSEMHWTNRRVARHPPAVPNQAEHVTFATTGHFIISLTPPVKNITIWVESFAIGSFFILKFRLTL